jgi:hypothetical protein
VNAVKRTFDRPARSGYGTHHDATANATHTVLEGEANLATATKISGADILNLTRDYVQDEANKSKKHNLAASKLSEGQIKM